MSIVPIESANQFNGDFNTDFLSVEQLSASDLECIHSEADAMHNLALKDGVRPVLEGRIYDTVFWDSGSTRTKYSFQHAITRLGGKVIDFHQGASSAGKGETFEDTIEMLDAYLVPGRDTLIIRHNIEGSVAAAAELADSLVINAGDGPGEHPTQGVMDSKIIRDRAARLDEAHVVFWGDLARARTVNSSAPLLAKMGIRRMTFVAPEEELRMSQKVMARLRDNGVEVAESDDLREVAPSADFIYAVRTQYEFMSDNPEVQAKARLRLTGKCLITPDMLKGSQALLMHPMPQDGADLNIHPDLRKDPRCIIKPQAASGEWTRMALLGLQAGKSVVPVASIIAS